MYPAHSTHKKKKKNEWNVTSKVRSVMPQTPKKYAKVVVNLAQKSTPKKRGALSD